MGTLIWRGDAPAVAQVQSYTLGGTWETTDVVRATIGGKTVNFVVGSATISTAIDNIVTAWNALSSTTYPEFAEITAAKNGTTVLQLTADTAGVPFTCTLTPLETNGGPADSQTIEGGGIATTGTATTASAGPNDWSTAANWSTAAVPVNSDDVRIENATIPILYGLSQTAVTLASLYIDRSTASTFLIGLPKLNASNYWEYRPDYLAISITDLRIEGGGGRIKINTGTNATTVTVNDSGTALETGVPAILWKGAHANNVCNINKGSFGAAFFASEAATIATMRQGYVTNEANDTDVTIGSGVTLTTLTKTGGELILRCSATTLTNLSGDVEIRDAAAITTLNAHGGTVYDRSTGTKATVNVAGAVLDCRRDNRPRTYTNTNLYYGAQLHDPAETITFTNPFAVKCAMSGVTLDIGTDITIQRA